MTQQQISIRPISDADIPAVIDLIAAQATRLHTLDAHLEAAHPAKQIAAMLAQQRDSTTSPPLVACNAQAEVRGYVEPGLWQLPSDSEMRAFFTACNGTMQNLTLPPPTDADAQAVLQGLLTALNTYWQEQRTTGDMARWPSCDLWLEPLLLAEGFIVDNVLAYHSPQPPPFDQRYVAAPPLRTRLARPDDEEILVKLHAEEITSHLPYTPFVHIVPSLESSFRSRLALTWKGVSVEEGAPLIVVVEKEREVVAFAENELSIIKADAEGFARLPPGRYAYVNNVGVRADMRRHGIGRTLVQAVFAACAPLRVDGYMLWFSQDNPLARTFWLRRGFQPVWRTYQRLHEERA